MSDKLAFLDEPEGSKETPAPTPEPVAEEKPQLTQESQSPATDPPPAEQPKPAPKEQGEWTVAMAMDERDKRIAIQKERDELAAWKAEQVKQSQAKPPIDPLTDPEGYARDLENKIEIARQDTMYATARRFAVKAYGADAVKGAEDAYREEVRTNPAAYHTLIRQEDPCDFLVKWHKRQQTFAKIGDTDPDAWIEQQLEARIKEKGYVLPERGPDGKFVAASPAPATPTPLPKPSLASAPAASGNAPKTPTGDGVAFNSAFRE